MESSLTPLSYSTSTLTCMQNMITPPTPPLLQSKPPLCLACTATTASKVFPLPCPTSLPIAGEIAYQCTRRETAQLCSPACHWPLISLTINPTSSQCLTPGLCAPTPATSPTSLPGIWWAPSTPASWPAIVLQMPKHASPPGLPSYSFFSKYSSLTATGLLNLSMPRQVS